MISLYSFNTGCGFNFSIGEVSSSERFRRAELRIHVKQPTSVQVPDSVYLRLYHGSRKGSYKIVSPIREGWIVFDVIDEVNQWRSTNRPHKKIHFYIVAYTNLDNLDKGENGKNCQESAIKFNQPSDTDDDTDNQPLLMIYSHDLDVIKFNVSALINNSTSERHRRQNNELSQPQVHSCGKHNLQINLTTFNNIWHLGERSQTALFPRTFDINVCGGQCNRDIPNSSAQHSIILYYLYTRGHTTSYENTPWGECCAPVKYRSIETLFSLPAGEIRIVLLRDMSVEQCSCLNNLQPTSQSR